MFCSWKTVFGLAILGTSFILINSSKVEQYNITQFIKPNKYFPKILSTVQKITKRGLSQGRSSLENTTNYRLPDNIIPREYFIRLKPFITPKNFTFDGTVKIIAQIKRKTSNIVLHVDQIEVHNVTIFSVTDDSNLEVQSISKVEKYQFLNITLKKPVNSENASYIIIDIWYKGILNDDMNGFYRSSYKIDNKTRWLASTHMEPTAARQMFPCFDEPALKAVFNIKVDLPQSYIALSNMPVKSYSIDNTVEFEKTPLMSTYLVAVVISNFENQAINGEKPWLYRAWSAPNLVDQVSYALSVAPKVLKFFETKLGVPYSLPKLDMVAVPDFEAGAMENWGLLTFREADILYDPSVMRLKQKSRVRGVVTHEIAHQWFGNLVTPSWWGHLWLSEAFAGYFEKHAHEDETALWDLDSLFVVETLQPSFLNDAALDAPSITRKVYSPAECRSMFDGTTYSKGASIVRMLEKILGSKMFFGALYRYLDANQFSSGTPNLLNSALEEEIKFNKYKLNNNISKVMNSWTLQSGFPVIDVRFTGDSVSLKQKRFFFKPQNIVDRKTWIIPINWATRSDPNFNDTTKVSWLTNQKVFTIKNASKDWVIFNIQQTGYYRVNYDENMWKRIIDTLKSEEYTLIHEINRASLIDDLFNLARAGLIDYNITLSGSQYLIQETNYIPWKAAFEALTYLKNRFKGHSEIYNLFRVYVISLLEPNYKKLGFNEIAEEQDRDVLLREMVLQWMCNLEYDECIQMSLNTFKNFQENIRYRLSPNQQIFVYCTAIKHGDTKHWDYLWKKLIKSKYSAERLTILFGLSCSKNSTNLERLLFEAVTPGGEIRKQDMKVAFFNVIGNSLIGLQTTLTFIGKNYNDIVNHIGDEKTIEDILGNISSLLSTSELVEKFHNFIGDNSKKLASISESLEKSLKNAEDQLNWFDNKSPKILKWLKANYES